MGRRRHRSKSKFENDSRSKKIFHQSTYHQETQEHVSDFQTNHRQRVFPTDQGLNRCFEQEPHASVSNSNTSPIYKEETPTSVSPITQDLIPSPEPLFEGPLPVPDSALLHQRKNSMGNYLLAAAKQHHPSSKFRDTSFYETNDQKHQQEDRFQESPNAFTDHSPPMDKSSRNRPDFSKPIQETDELDKQKAPQTFRQASDNLKIEKAPEDSPQLVQTVPSPEHFLPLQKKDTLPETIPDQSLPTIQNVSPKPKDNGIVLEHRVEKPECSIAEREVNYTHRKTKEVPAKRNAAQQAAIKNRQQRLFREKDQNEPNLSAKKQENSIDFSAASAGRSQVSQKADSNIKSRGKQPDNAKPPICRKQSESIHSQAKDENISDHDTLSGKDTTRSNPSSAKRRKKAKTDKKQKSKNSKPKSRLQFTPEEEFGKPSMTSMAKSCSRKTTGFTTGTAAIVIHGKLHEEEQDNVAVEAAHKSELLAEQSIREMKNLRKSSRLREQKVQHQKESILHQSANEAEKMFHMGEPAQKQKSTTKKSLLNRFFQKQQNKRKAAQSAKAAKEGTNTAEKATKSTASTVERSAVAVREFFVTHKKGGLVLVSLLLLFVFLLTQLQSCSVIASQTLGAITASSWPAEDSEITQADMYYTQLEADLQHKIDTVKSRHSGCDEYNYNLGEIGHDPVILISYLCAKYGSFTFNREIKQELNTLFALQYQLTEEVVNETRTITKMVRVGESLGNVVTSGYCNCSICCGQWSGGPTASGVYPQAAHTIAVDASNPFVPMGTKVVMNGVEYTVEDTGNFDQYGVQFDVYYDNHSAASAHGHQTWEAFIADDNGSQEVEVTTTENVKVCYVTLISKNLQFIVTSRMNTDQKGRYDIYTSSRGNRQFLGSPFDYNWHGNISSYFGYRISPNTGNIELHKGLDIAMPEGTEILSVQNGTVQTAGYSNSYGNYIVIKNDKGYETLYAHCKTLRVSPGQEVQSGDVIATVGSTGNSTGNHLHIEFLYKGDYYNPYFYLNTGSESIYGGGEPLTTEKARRLFEEAEKYLGMPYVWGGSSPSTGFDCSGFVSYVFTNSGVYNMGRLTAQGIYDICTPISAAEAQPGDIIFFKGTYDTPGVSHVGIYAGNGQMIHCGDPIQYTSIETSYWQSHFYSFGRVGD